MYEILTGPLLWFAFAVFFIGLGARVVLYFLGLDWRLDRVAYKPHMAHGLKGAALSVYRWVLPFGTHSWREKPIFTIMFFAMHAGLVVVPLFLEGHAVMIKSGTGIDWPSIHSNDTSTSVFSCSIVTVSAVFLSRRITNAVRLSEGFRGSLTVDIGRVSFIAESLPTPFTMIVSVRVAIIN